MRGLINFDAGELVTFEGRHLNFHGLVPPVKDRSDGSYDLQFLDARNRKANILTPDQFMSAYEAGHVQYHRARKMAGDEAGDDETPSNAISRRWRLFWTTSFDAAPVPKSTKKLKAFIEQNVGRQPDPISRPSPHTLRRWLRDRGEQDARRPKQMGDRRRSSLARRPVHEFVQNAFDEAAKKYWSNYRATFQDVQLEVRAAVMTENLRRRKESLSTLSVPGRTTLWRWLRQERTYPNVLTREGRYAADRLFKGARGSLSAKRILDVTIIDQKRMDVHICDPSGKFTIGRPWLAVLMDVKSRMVLGYSLSFEEPSVLTAMACIRAAMGGPRQLKERFPSVEGLWESFGMPRTILVDNAWENTGSSFADACSDNNISIEYAPVRTPQYKGILERFFSRLDDQFAHKLPGAVIDNPYALAQRRIDPQSDACLTLLELEELLCRYFVDIYAWDIHTALGAAPVQVWRECVQRDGIELAHDRQAVELAMAKMVRDRVLSHEGVKFLSLTYRSDAVDALLRDLLPLQAAKVRPGSAKVKIKYHPEDLSRIFVWNEASNAYVILPCVHEIYARGLSERVHLELQAQARSAADDFVSDEERSLKKGAFLASLQQCFDKLPFKERKRRARMLAEPHESSIIKIDPISTRLNGDNPEKGTVRSRRISGKRKPVPPVAVKEMVQWDPFADFDRESVFRRSWGPLP